MSARKFAAAALLGLAGAQNNPNATWSSCCTSSNTECVSWSSITFSPAAPNPGDTLYVNGTGVIGGAVQNSTKSQGLIEHVNAGSAGSPSPPRVSL